MLNAEKRRLGDMLVHFGHLLQGDLKEALDHQKTSGEQLGRILVSKSYVTEDQVAKTMAHQLDVPYFDLRHSAIDSKAVRRLSEGQSRRLRALVINEQGGVALVGMVDPSDLLICDELKRLLKSPVSRALVTETALLETIDRIYRRTDEISGLAHELSENLSEVDMDLDALSDASSLDAAPVAKLLQTIFDDAMRVRASDVHIEPMETNLHIRFRIDGMLHLQIQADMNIAQALVLRLKLMSGMDISDKRLPQDGRFNVRIRNDVVDVRVSTLPDQHGESVVLRLLNRSGSLLTLDKLGMPTEMLATFRKVIHRSEGMVLVTGPTGSGKTTTLYAALSEINTLDQKIITVEDPVEYRLPGIKQVQVNDKIDLDFARVLRAILRHDPDVIMVGEMRDPETAQIGLRASITGHLVFSTLHTRDAAGTLTRLVDMGVPKYMVASSVQMLLSQRLLRRICDSCETSYEPTPQVEEWLLSRGVGRDEWGVLRKGSGCARCNNTGYIGRFPVYEMLEMTRELIDIAAHRDMVHFTQAAREQMKGRTLLDDALSRMRLGHTTPAEVIRIYNMVDD